MHRFYYIIALVKSIFWEQIYMNMYDRIEQILDEERISKRKLSIDLDIPYTTLVSMFKRRSLSVDIETIKKIAHYLGVDLDFLVDGDIYPTATKYGTAIKEFRLKANIKRVELSKLSGYTPQQIKDIEENKQTLTFDEYVELSSFVCDSVVDAIIDEDYENASKPIGLCYVQIWNGETYAKYFMTREQVDSVDLIAKQFGDNYNKNKGIKL